MAASYRKEYTMKRYARFLGVLLCFLFLSACILPASVFAAQTEAIDTSTSSEGYFTVCYRSDCQKMKVAVSFGQATGYYNYTPGETSSYTFSKGDGDYTITLYRHLYGNSYTPVASKKVTVNMQDDLAPYRVSTDEITFSAEDAVGLKAAELCEGLTDTASKVIALHNYVAATLSYDYEFAAGVTSGVIKTYVPNTSKILDTKKGICYDFSALFAALCRSQDIPCALEKGYYYGGYHAWNKVYVDGNWYTLDLTMASAYRNSDAQALEDCIFHMTADSGYSYSR
ncbi:MAG: transglutaminase domain-containing protein [Clostridia bacterium]|nr:transglutaminase domain-containing protein [Clostridia bacterium]